ncbi:IclR family transcriptional regulator domain-containing protein, partial [Salmonella enterica subsp. enterica serovar Infantis]
RLGLGYDNEEDSIGVRCIAVQVFNTQGKVIDDLSVSGFTLQIPDDKRESRFNPKYFCPPCLTRLMWRNKKKQRARKPLLLY